ncbi:cAMP-dependent protein kinase catalytic subunit alpha-like [Ptychodera flava]|uniref:cAMP-dependent protein kinase catalytic subunit alpha-like n=1 Tax=Ptychodera flava TaxID=63121 RepID=UPI003969D3FD
MGIESFTRIYSNTEPGQGNASTVTYSGVGEASNQEIDGINGLIIVDKEIDTIKESDDNSSDNNLSDRPRRNNRRRNVVWRFFHRVRKRMSRLFGRTRQSDESESTGTTDEVKVTKTTSKGKQPSQDVIEVDKRDILNVMEIKAAGSYSKLNLGSVRDHKDFYAMKYLSKSQHLDERTFKEFMENEIYMNRALTKLNNDNFVRMIGLCQKDDLSSILVLEYVPGLNMKEYLDKYGETLPLVGKYEIMLKVTNALKALHGIGIIHNDLKLSNILLQRPEMKVKLTDFRFSCYAKSPKFNGAGSLMYAAPELFKFEVPPCNKAKDMWALGCCMAQIVTLKTAHDEQRIDGDIMEEIIAKVENGEVVIPLNIAMLEEGQFKNLCQRCCDMQPANRPNAKKVYHQVKKLLAKEKEEQNKEYSLPLPY